MRRQLKTVVDCRVLEYIQVRFKIKARQNAIYVKRM